MAIQRDEGLGRSAARAHALARLSRPVDRDLRGRAPAALDGLIAFLRAPGDVNLDAVEVALQTLELDADALSGAIFEDDAAYVRTLLYRDERLELLALTWLPGQRSPLHDHGEATAIMRVVSGEAVEHIYRGREYLTRSLRPGVVSRTPPERMHTLGNDVESNETLVTLHVYTPPLHAD